VPGTTGRPTEVLREGSGIKVGGTAGEGLTISTYIKDAGNLAWQKTSAPDLSSTAAEQTVVAQGSDRDEFFYHARSLLVVRGPAPAAKATMPDNTPPKAMKLVISATRHRTLESRKSAIAPHNKQSPHSASTVVAGIMRGSRKGPMPTPEC